MPVPRIERYPWLQKKVKTPPESVFAALQKMRLPDGTNFPSPRETAVARLLGAQLTADGKKGEISLILPPAQHNTRSMGR
jgi:hypothetical protein